MRTPYSRAIRPIDSRRSGVSLASSAARTACSCTILVSLNWRASSSRRSCRKSRIVATSATATTDEQQQREAPEQRPRQQRHGAALAGTGVRRVVVRHEDVAESPDRLDVARIGRVGLDQLAQPRHLHVDRAVEHVVVAAAGEERQLLARQRLARVLREHLDERELARREVDRRVAVDERARREVERERTERDLALGRRRTRREAFGVPAQHGLDAGDELARIERLRQVVVGAHLETDDAVDVLALGGQHDDGHAVAGGAQAAADREPVLAGQHEVEHDQMRRIALELPVEIARVGQGGDLEALLGQIAGQEIAQAHVVVDDQDLRRGRFGGHG